MTVHASRPSPAWMFALAAAVYAFIYLFILPTYSLCRGGRPYFWT